MRENKRYNRSAHHSYCAAGRERPFTFFSKRCSRRALLIYYIKINVEKSVKLDECKKVLYSCNPYIACSIETTFLRKNIYGLGKKDI
jgi:hypothetical protein